MPSNYLRDEERIVRFVPWSKLRRDEDDNVLGPLPQAFELREDEEYLSVTWCEYFNGGDDERLRCAIEAVRNSALTVGRKARFAVGNVGDVREAVEGRPNARKLRMIHQPEDDNQAHAALRHWPRSDHDLLALLAEDAWSGCMDATAADALPLTECSIGLRGMEK